MLFVLVIIFVVIIAIDAPELVKRRQWKEFVVFLIILCLGMFYSVGQIYSWSLPNPERKLEYLVKPYMERLNTFFLE